MKGLLIKDWLVLWRQMKLYLVLIVALALVPSSGTAGFAILYGAIMPYTSLAFDERTKWDRLAATMPCSGAQIVLSKYIIGYALSLAATLLACVASVVYGAGDIGQYGLMFCAATAFTAVLLPAMFRLGVEKGRLIYIILIAFVAAFVMNGALTPVTTMTLRFPAAAVAPAVVGATVLLNVVSVWLSEKLYEGRER